MRFNGLFIHTLGYLLAPCFLSGLARGDTVIPDDVIVNGRVIAGTNAVSDPTSLLFQLRSDAPRLTFFDTSTGTFPSGDWSIVANDVAPNGESFLGFFYLGVSATFPGNPLFRVMAGAREHAFMINSNSYVGVGTDAPGARMHVVEVGTVGVRLDQTGTNGVQTWDLASDGTNLFVQNPATGRVPFRLERGSPPSSVMIETNGWVGWEAAHPNARLHVHLNRSAGDTAYIGGASGPGTNSATLFVNGSMFISQTLSQGSSRHRKEGIRPLDTDAALEALAGLRPVHFRYRKETESQLGFIAEDVPDLVAMEGRASVAVMDFLALLTAIVQDHETREQDLFRKIAQRQAVLERAAARLDQLESRATSRTISHR